jgi:glycosyltransferase involved in cell wall biosynthesis
MEIEVFALAHNEEFIMPYLMRHYSQFAKVTILENNSTDKTVEIAKKMGAKVIEFNVPDVKSNRWNSEVKNECWKTSNADWVIVIDADEFIYHPNLVKILRKTDATIMKSTWCEMYSDKIPTGEWQIYDKINKGIEYSVGNAKLAILRPDRIEDMNWGVGCHAASPEGDVIYGEEGIKTLHFRHLSIDYVLERNRYTSKRMSSEDKMRGWGVQYSFPEERVVSVFNECLKKSVKIL